MYTYEIETESSILGLGTRNRTISQMSEIAEEVEILKVQAHFAVLVSPPIDGVDAIQVMLQANTKGFFKKVSIPPEYSLDIVVKNDDGEEKLWYMSDIMGHDEMYNILMNFMEHQKLPNYKVWFDATKDMLKNDG